MRKLKRAIKRSSGVVLASAMILNSSGVMTFAQTLELEKTITSIEQSYGINSQKTTTTDTIEETSTESATEQVQEESTVEATQLAEQPVEQASEEVSEQEAEAVVQEQPLDIGEVEAPEIVTANVDTRIGDGLRTLLNNGTELTGTVVGDEYQIAVKKGQNIGFYSNSADCNVKISDGEFEYAEYNEISNNSFGTSWYKYAAQGNYLIVTALNDGTISIPSQSKDSIEIKLVTSPAIKHNTVEAGKSYELKLADDWENSICFRSNKSANWFEYAVYGTNGINKEFGTNKWYVDDYNLDKKEDEDKVREVITSIIEEDVEVIYPYEYDVTAVTFVESKTPALKHNTVKAGESYEIKLSDGWDNRVDFVDNYHNSNWLEFSMYNSDGTVDGDGFGMNTYHIRTLSKGSNHVREVITSIVKEDVDVAYPYEYDEKAVIFTKSETPALKHNTVKAGESYEIKLSDGWDNEVSFIDNDNYHDWLEYSMYNSDGKVDDGWFGINTYYIRALSKESNHVKEVITSIVEDDVDVVYPYEYDKKAVTFTKSTVPALARQIIEPEKSYQIKLKEGQTVNPTFKVDNFDIEYAIYKNNGECYKHGDDGNGAYIYHEMSVSNGITNLVFTSKAKEDKELIYPYEYGVNVMTFSESEAPALLRKTIKTGHSYELKLVDENVNEFCLYNVTDVEYAIYGDDGQCSDFGKDYEYNNFILNRKYNETRLVITATGNVDYDVVIPAQYDNKVITFDEIDKGAIASITLGDNGNFKLTNTGKYEIKPLYGDNFVMDVVYDNNNASFQSTSMPSIRPLSEDTNVNNFVYVSTYNQDNTIIIPAEYSDNLKIEYPDEPIFNRIQLKAGETVKLTSKADMFSTTINVRGDNTSKISTLVMNPNRSGELSSDTALHQIMLVNNQELYIQASSDNVSNVLVGVLYKEVQNKDVTVEKTDIDLAEANNFENVTNVTVKEAKAVKSDEEQVTYTTALSDYKYTMFNETTNQYISGYKYNTSGELAFSNGSVNEGDVISITLSSDKIDTVTQKFTYNKNGNVELNVAQKGGYLITVGKDLNTNFYLFDSEGNIVNTNITNRDIEAYNMTGGNYKLLVIRTDEEYVNNLTSLSDLELYGLEKDKDYTLTDLEVKAGVISTLDVSNYVSLREDKTLTSFDKSKTKVTASSDTLIGDDKVTITVDYAIDSKFEDWELNQIDIEIPYYYIGIVEDSVKINDENVKYTYNSYGKLTVNTSNKSGKLTFDIEKSTWTTDTSTVYVSANLTKPNNEGTINNTIGKISIKQYGFDFSTNSIVSKNEAVLTGSNTVPGQKVAIFVDDKRVATVKTDSNGDWKADIALPEKKIGASYKIYASLYTGTDNEIKTAEKQVIYNPISSTVAQFNLLYNSTSYNIIAINDTGSKLNLTPGSSNKFTLGFGATDVKDVYVVGIKDGVEKKIKATKDANGNWVAEGYFDDDETFVPDVYNVIFTEEGQEEEKLEVTASASTSTVKSGDSVTISTALKNANGKYTYKFIVYDTDTQQFTDLQDFSSDSSYTWNTTATDVGSKQIYVDVKDSEGNITRSNAVDVKVERVEEVVKPLAISATKEEADKTVTFTATGNGGSGEYTYKFIVYNKTTNTWTKLQDFSEKNTFTWTKEGAGDRYFYVDVKDNSTGEVVRSEALNVKIEETQKPLAISATKQEADKTVTFTAEGNGGSGKYSYKFIVYNKTTNSWAKLQDFSEKNTFTWTKGNAGDRYFYVDVKDNTTGKTVRSEALNVKLEETTKPLAISATKKEADKTVTFTAEGSGGSGKYSYKFIVYNKTTNSWAKLQDFSSKNTFTWTKGNAGDRYFYVDVKDNTTGKTVRSQALNVKIDATSTPTSTLTASTANVSVGGKVTLTAKATAGSGKYTYKFLIYNPATKQWAKLQDFSNNSTFTWTAGSAGERQFYVDVKDSNGKVTRSKVVNVQVGNAQSVTKLSVKATASTTANKVGQNVTFTATANGGAGGYTYKFLVYNKTTKQWAKIQDFSATSKLTWKAGSAGERQFYVDVKDKNGNTVRSSVMNVKTTK